MNLKKPKIPLLQGSTCRIFIWMLAASQIAVLAGSVVVSAIIALSLRHTLLELAMVALAIVLVAAVCVNLVVLFIAYPIRLLWRKTLSVAVSTCACGLAGRILYSSPMILDAYTAFFTDSNLMIGDGSPQDAIQGITALFIIGALYGAIFGYFYSSFFKSTNTAIESPNAA